MSPQDLRDVLTIALALLSIGSMLYTWLTSRAKANSRDIEKLDQDLRRVDARVATIESEMGHLPSKEAFHQMALSIVEMRGEISVLSERLKPVASISERLQDFMLREGKAA